MSTFELSRHITIGQYLPTGSPIHRMDPRSKLVAFVILVGVSAYLSSLIGHALLLCVGIALVVLARIPVRFAVSGIIPAIPILIIMFPLTVLLYNPGTHDVYWFHWGILHVTRNGVLLAVIATVRFVEIVLFISTLTLSTTLSDITHAVERLLSPLRAIRFPVHETALILTIALRFVPTFAQEAERLVKAQASRGADLGTARWWQIVRRTKSVFPIVLPLFLTALRRAEDLVQAMEARGYDPGRPRTSYISFCFGVRDLRNLCICFAVSALLVFIPWPW